MAGEHVAGGALIIAGGLCLVAASGAGRAEFVGALTNWLYFWR